MNKTYKSILILVTLIIILILYLFNSNFIISNIIDYSILFFKNLFPVAFIFYTFSSLLIDYGLISTIEDYFHVKGTTVYIFIISLISGFPSGSKYTKELFDKGFIDINTANRYIMFSHFPNPLFVFGTVNLVLKDSFFSSLIFLSILISNIITMFIFKSKNNFYTSNYSISNSFTGSLSYAFNDAFKIILLIYGNSLFFYLISSIILKYCNFSRYFYIIVSGMFDLTKGVFSVIILNNIIIKSFFILLFISFGGISIHMQVNSIINGSDIKYSNFLIGRIISTLIAFCIFFIFILLKK